MTRHSASRAISAATLLALISVSATAPRRLSGQSLEGSKWRVEQEGMDSAVVWWFGSESRVRTGDLGIILPAYKWRQAGDSVFVTIGDTVKYAAVLMSNRLVGGIRSGRSHPEGWWSGTRADAAAPASQLASTPATQNPATTPSTQQLSRPTDSTSAPPATSPAPAPTGGGHPLRAIQREGAATPTDAGAGQPAGGGRVLRRIQRAEAAAATSPAPATGAVDTAMAGSWVRADSVGMIDAFELTADGKAMVHLRNGANHEGAWATDPQSTHITMQGENGNEVRLVIWEGGPGLRGTIVTAAGPRRTLAFRRAPANPRP